MTNEVKNNWAVLFSSGCVFRLMSQNSLLVIGFLPIIFACTPVKELANEVAIMDVRILETTDLHSNMMDYDYYKSNPTQKFGLTRTASLIKKARLENPNSVLVDNGDLIQGSPMGDYYASKGVVAGEVHPVFKAMNLLKYEVGNVGNHEFNYGIEYLDEVLNDAQHPYISANIYKVSDDKLYLPPYILKKYVFKDRSGKEQKLTIGYIGFVPPQIEIWDKKNLEGKLYAKDIKASAEKFVPKMKKEGADIVVAIPHSGISTKPHELGAENSTYYLSQVAGIDAIAFGHSHAIFPGPAFDNLPGVDYEKGLINGVAAVMPGRWGSHLGVIDLVLERRGHIWQVLDSSSKALPIYDVANKNALVEADKELLAVLAKDHSETKTFVDAPIGRSSAPMYSFLALIQDDPTVEIVNLAQKDYVEKFIEGDPHLGDLPVLSAAAPFRAGGRRNDPTNYTEIDAGILTFRNAADLYLYPNTLSVVKVTGAQVKEWLECSASQFNQIDTQSSKTQELINWNFPTYNFDVIDGVKYQIDLSIAPRYDRDCALVNDSYRILNLSYKGKPIDETREFLIATNNYRAYGGKFAGTGSEYIAFDSPDENRVIIANYISRMSRDEGSIKPNVDGNWSFKPLGTNVPLDIRFLSSASAKAKKFIVENARYPMHFLQNDQVGFAIYRLELQ